MNPPPAPRRLLPSRLALAALGLALGAALAGHVWHLHAAQPGPPPARKHRANQARPVTLEPATEPPPGENRRSFEPAGESLTISANAIPAHAVGRFPNRGNPHAIAEQAYQFSLPARPSPAGEITWLHRASPAGARGPRPAPNIPFGIALNGVLFDPGTAEFWNGDRASNWNYEALGGTVPLGLDANYAHVQPNGAYHYHGLPKLYLESLGLSPEQHSPMIGRAADGFPIYALYGWRDPQNPASGVKPMRSSYRLREGARPAPPAGPGGSHDGAFVQDYEFVPGSGDLDECNGRFTVTPEFANGTYAYFLTEDWPVIPRGFRGTPVPLRGAGGPTGPGGGRGPRR